MSCVNSHSPNPAQSKCPTLAVQAVDGQSLAGQFEHQVRQTFKNLEATLGRVRGSLTDVVWINVSISDGRYSQVFTEIRKDIYGRDFPASTLLTTAALAHPDILVEITPVPVIPD